MVLAQELAPHGVRANVIAPGYVSTKMTARHFTDADGHVDPVLRDEVLERTRKTYPLGVLADPDDLANMILYLVSDASRVVTGQVFRPNAGLAMPW
jgi:3-oxoacyl-[acyl-carrier protein] reductase